MPPVLAAIPPLLSSVGLGSAATAMAGAIAPMVGAGTTAITAGANGVTAATGASLATAASVAGMGLAALGQIQQGNMQTDIMEANAESAKMEAASASEASKNEQLKLSKERNQTIGSQANIFGGAGLDPSSGSPLDVMAQTASNYERDIQQLGYAGASKTSAKLFESSIYDWAAPQQRRAGWMGAAGTVLSGVGTLARAKKFGLPTYQ